MNITGTFTLLDRGEPSRTVNVDLTIKPSRQEWRNFYAAFCLAKLRLDEHGKGFDTRSLSNFAFEMADALAAKVGDFPKDK